MKTQLKRYNQDIAQLEDQAINFLLTTIAAKRANPQLVLQDLTSYELLIKRPRVIMSLDAEKEIIQRALVEYLEKLRTKIVAKKSAYETMKGPIRYVEDILWSTIQAQKVGLFRSCFLSFPLGKRKNSSCRIFRVSWEASSPENEPVRG